MKKKLAVLLGVLVLSSVAFSAPAKKAPASKPSLESSLSSLEAQLQRLEQMENKKFEEQEAVANAAQQRLDNYLKMDAAIDQRIADIETNAETSIFGKEFKQKAAEYRKLKEELAKEIKTKEVFRHWELDSILQIFIARGREAATKIAMVF